MTSGGSRRRECPASAKKPTRSPTGAVCRSGTRLHVHSRASPSRRENRNGFPGSEVFGTGTLPVGFQGRSALVAKGEIPDRETCMGVYHTVQMPKVQRNALFMQIFCMNLVNLQFPNLNLTS